MTSNPNGYMQLLKEEQIDKRDVPTPSSNANMRIIMEDIHLKETLPPQDGHKAVVYPEEGENQKVYIYGGGYFNQSSNSYMYKDSLFVFDVNTQTWTNMNQELKSTTEVPPPLIGFSMIVRDIPHSSSFVIFGGTTTNRVRTRDIYEFSFQKQEWKKLHCVGLDTCLAGHSAHWHSEADHMYTFFGKNESNDHVDDVYRLDLKTQTWALVQKKGTSPQPRSSHSSVLWKNNFVIIFGGENVDDKKFNDTWMFNISSEEWIPLEVRGDIPETRCFHASVLYGDNMIVYGGYPENNELHMLDLNSLVWKRLRIDPYIPNEYKVQGHVLCLIKQPKSIYPKLLSYGGSNIKERQLNHFYTFELRNFASRTQELLCCESFSDAVVVTQD